MKKIRGVDFLALALYAFAGLGLEIVLLILESNIYGVEMNQFNMFQTILHWVLTCVLWGIAVFLLVHESIKKYNFNPFKQSESVSVSQWIGAIACFLIVFIISYINWNGFKVVKEFESRGLVKFIVQYAYYLVETSLFLAIVVFGQKTGEMWFKNNKIPYGGIVVAMTWGLMHMFTKGSLEVGFLVAFSGIMYGCVYLLLGKNLKWTYIMVALMFVL